LIQNAARGHQNCPRPRGTEDKHAQRVEEISLK
jgi:hypothetical protein